MTQREHDNETMGETAALTTSLAELRTLVLEQQSKLEQQGLFIDSLLKQIRLAPHQHLGTRNERFSIDQPALVLNEAEASDEQNADQPDTLGTVAGANASANRYSLIETAKANGIEPYAYLRTVFTALPRATSVY